MLVHWIWFSELQKISSRVKMALLDYFHDPEQLFYADHDAPRYVENIPADTADLLLDRDLSHAQEVLEQCRRGRIHIVTLNDAGYPRRLKAIPDPPLVLYYKGQLPELDELPSIGVVGTRKASAYGLTTAKRMGYQIGKCGGIVVSGMASGIDTLAMKGALTAGASVVGVLGCGADVVYPPSNRTLYEDVQAYGCILTEYTPGTPPLARNFPRRNRIISGLSNGVLVVEAPERSGALITARMALDQGRDVFAVPGNIDVPTCAGSNLLLRDGATAVFSGWDILSEYEAIYPGKVLENHGACTATPSAAELHSEENVDFNGADSRKKTGQTADKRKVPDKKDIDKGPNRPYSDVNRSTPSFTEEERKIMDALQAGQRLADDVVAETGLTAGKFLAAMTTLEIKGFIRRLPGKRIEPAGSD